LSNVRELLADLADTLYATNGIGLAAPQIGVDLRVAVVDATRKHGVVGHGLLTLIDPMIVHEGGIKLVREGCLSIPDFTGNVKRYEAVTVASRDINGRMHAWICDGLEAIAVQHEIDHLDGRVFLDRISNLKRDLIPRKV